MVKHYSCALCQQMKFKENFDEKTLEILGHRKDKIKFVMVCNEFYEIHAKLQYSKFEIRISFPI